jgi:hypothetical protein
MMTQLEEHAPTIARKPLAHLSTWSYLLVFLMGSALVGAWLWGVPGGLLQKLDLVGYAICHRILERSFVIGGRQLPLCARCTGIYLGVASNLAVMTLLRRRRSAQLPRPILLATLGTFLVVMGGWT